MLPRFRRSTDRTIRGAIDVQGAGPGSRRDAREPLQEAVHGAVPEEKLQISALPRAAHPDAARDGLERCVGCELCAGRLPGRPIFVEAAENDPERPNSHGERYAKRYEINMLRCIFCGMCEEACPEDAIYLEKKYELAITSATRSSIQDRADGRPEKSATSRTLSPVAADTGACRLLLFRVPPGPATPARPFASDGRRPHLRRSRRESAKTGSQVSAATDGPQAVHGAHPCRHGGCVAAGTSRARPRRPPGSETSAEGFAKRR